MNVKFYEEMDKLFDQIEEFLNNYSKSKILQNYFLNQFISFFYANLVNNFFINLNKENAKDYNLPKGKIGVIKRRYRDLQKDIELALSMFLVDKNIDSKYYTNFKKSLSKEFPGFLKIVDELEKIIDIRKAKKYLKGKSKKIKKSGKLDSDFNNLLLTGVIEAYVENKNCLPFGKKLDTILKSITKEAIPEMSTEVMKELHKNADRMLRSQRSELKGFETRLYDRWKEPLDLLECLIRVSQESGEEHKFKISNKITKQNNYKFEALLKLHRRAIQISKEILVLLKSGYPDGANARWRSLHELAVISFFLLDNTNDVSKRYLDHEIVSSSKQAESYTSSYKKLGYKPLGKKVFNKIKNREKALCKKYGNYFKNDYGWIPKSLWPKGSNGVGFSFLENKTKLSHLNPFYKLACDSLHGGSKGLYSLGLMDKYQNKILLVGPSNYGLADPLQNTAISLLHTSICILNLEPDFESLLQMNIMSNYVKFIGEKAASIQDVI